MQLEARKLLEDMKNAGAQILSIAGTRTLDQYKADRALRWSIERGFEIIGEALTQLSRCDPVLAARISDHRSIISFRNILIHGYARINNDTTWSIVQKDLPVLLREVDQLLAEP
jgi:uncharacterized protein with HEPN domain